MNTFKFSLVSTAYYMNIRVLLPVFELYSPMYLLVRYRTVTAVTKHNNSFKFLK